MYALDRPVAPSGCYIELRKELQQLVSWALSFLKVSLPSFATFPNKNN